MKPIVLVASSSYNKGQAVFRSAEDIDFRGVAEKEKVLASEVKNCGTRAVVVSIEPYHGPLYEALAQSAAGGPSLIARFGVGHDSVDKTLARMHGNVVTNTPGVLDDSVAEHTIWLLGNLAKHINRHDLRVRQGVWKAETGVELRGKTLAVIGFGAIGRRVAMAAHFGFGMRVLAVGARTAEEFERRENRPLGDLLSATGVDEYTDNLAAALPRAHAVTLHAPASATTRHLINRERLELFHAGALLINTSRGALVDEEALYDALAAQRLGGAGLDVFTHEPYRPVVAEKDLRNLENTLLTPHIGSNTVEANRRMAESVLGSVRHFLAGRLDLLPRVDAA